MLHGAILAQITVATVFDYRFRYELFKQQRNLSLLRTFSTSHFLALSLTLANKRSSNNQHSTYVTKQITVRSPYMI